MLHSVEPVISNTFKTALTNAGCTTYDYTRQTGAQLYNHFPKNM